MCFFCKARSFFNFSYCCRRKISPGSTLKSTSTMSAMLTWPYFKSRPSKAGWRSWRMQWIVGKSMNNLTMKPPSTTIFTLWSLSSVEVFSLWTCSSVLSSTTSMLSKRSTKEVFWKCFWLKAKRTTILPWKSWGGKNLKKSFGGQPMKFMPSFMTSPCPDGL